MIDIAVYLNRSWQHLTLEEQEALAAAFGTPLGVAVSRPFTQEQHIFLESLFLDVSGNEDAIKAIGIDRSIKIWPIQTTDGRSVVPAAILTDPVNYEPYLSITTVSPLLQLTNTDFPQLDNLFPGQTP